MPASGTNSRPLRGIVLGAGYFSRFHFDAWHRLGVEIVAVVERDVGKAREAATRHGIPRVGHADELANVLDAEKPDFIDIITPPATHLESVRLAAARGVAIIC